MSIIFASLAFVGGLYIESRFTVYASLRDRAVRAIADWKARS